MKRCALLLLAVLTVWSCTDDRTPTGPGADLQPSFSALDGPNADRILLLIQDLYPTEKQLLAKALKKWVSIEDKMAAGSVEEAQGKALELADKTVEYLGDGKLLTPDGPDLPETASEGVAELVMRLFVYVGWPSSTATDRYQDFFSDLSGDGDSGYGVAVPDEPTVIVTDHAWASVAVPAGSVAEPVFISIELVDDPSCEAGSDLQQALGCWDFNRVPEGEFLEPITVSICVDPTPVPLELEDYILVHEKDEVTGDVTPLPWADPQGIDCSLFVVDGTAPLLVGSTTQDGLWSSIRHGLARMLLPEPLVAHRLMGRPPIGIGGLGGSFSFHYGAVPDYTKAEVGTGSASAWEIEEPSDAASLCNWVEAGPCAGAVAVNEMDVTAVATGASGNFPNPLAPGGKVLFYYHEAGSSDPPVLFDELAAASAVRTDDGTYRYYTWSTSLPGEGLLAGSLEIFAVAVEDDGDFFATPLNTNTTVVIGEEVADAWTVATPSVPTEICDPVLPAACPTGAAESVDLEAVAQGPTGSYLNPFGPGSVEFYYRPAGSAGTFTPAGSVAGSSAAVTDEGLPGGNRYYTWTLELPAAGLPRGPLEIVAIGRDGGGLYYLTPKNEYVTVVSDLVSYWQADGNYSDYFGLNNGQTTGSVPFVTGVSGQAFDLRAIPSEVYVQPVTSEITGLQELTVAAWVNLDPSGPPDVIQRFVSVGVDKAVLRQEGGPGSNRMLHFYMKFTVGGDDNGLAGIRVDNQFQTGCYQFFAGTYGTDDYMRAYLDGTEVGYEPVPGGVVSPGYDFTQFGSSGSPGNPGEEMEGFLDEIMIFNRALTPEEIQALYDLVPEGSKCGPYPTFNLSGTVSENDSALAGSTVLAVGPESRTVTTASNGSYAFSGLTSGEYQVYPKFSGSYAEPSRIVKSTGEDRTANFSFMTPSGQGTAIIDGISAAGEWDVAACRSYTASAVNPTPPNTTHNAELCLMNDGTNLYAKVTVDRDGDPWSHFLLTLYDRFTWVDDAFGVDLLADQAFFDAYYTSPTSLQMDDLATGGSEDGTGTVTRDVQTVFEAAHPLNSGDPFDFSAAPGRAFDIKFGLWLCDSSGGSCAASGLPGPYPLNTPLTLILR